jgi:ferrous iron transport protein B
LLAAAPEAEQSGAWRGMLESLRGAFHSGAAAFAYLLFVLTYSPCFAALAVLSREAGWRWMAFSLGYQTLLAWMVATAFYQVATWNAHPVVSAGWVALVGALGLTIVLALRCRGRALLKVEAI